MPSLYQLGLFSLLVLGLSSCSSRLNTRQIEADLKAEIETQGKRINLARVQCPKGVTKQAQGYLRCVGELPSGDIFTINVVQQDDQGTISWDIPSSQTIINLVSLEKNIQTGFSEDLGQRVLVDCDESYRLNTPNDTFACDVVGGVTVGGDRIEEVLVKVDKKGNLEWSEVRSPIAAAPAGPAVSSPVANPAAASTPQTTSASGTAPPDTTATEGTTDTKSPTPSVTETDSADSNPALDDQ
jgi:hypothetical protein